MRLFFLIAGLLISFGLAAQERNVDATSPAILVPEDMPTQQHQLYLNEPMQKVVDVEYLDGTPIKFDLDQEGKTVFLLDYFKRGAVRVKALDFDGNLVEVTRSPCFIDPVAPS